MLPGWEPPKRALPKPIAQSAVFTARRDRDMGEDLARGVIRSVGATIEYEGPLLNQSHADVWETLLYACRMRGTGRLDFRPNALLKLLSEGAERQRRLHPEDRLRLLQLMKDLSRARVQVFYPDASMYSGGLVSFHWTPDESYAVELSDDIVRLFHDDGCVMIDWRMRVGIKGELAKWLQHYFAASLDPMLIEEIRALSSSQTRDIYRFRQAVRTALAELVRVGAITAGEIRGRYVLASVDPSGQLPKLPRLVP